MDPSTQTLLLPHTSSDTELTSSDTELTSSDTELTSSDTAH